MSGKCQSWPTEFDGRRGPADGMHCPFEPSGAINLLNGIKVSTIYSAMRLLLLVIDLFPNRVIIAVITDLGKSFLRCAHQDSMRNASVAWNGFDVRYFCICHIISLFVMDPTDISAHNIVYSSSWDHFRFFSSYLFAPRSCSSCFA
jgi:hypothetical protein